MPENCVKIAAFQLIWRKHAWILLILNERFMNQVSNGLHGTFLSAFLNTKLLPVWHFDPLNLIVRLLNLAKLLMVLIWDHFEYRVLESVIFVEKLFWPVF